MTLKEAHTTLYRICIEKKLPVNVNGHYQTYFKFGTDSVYVNPDGSDVVSYKFNISGCIKHISSRFIHKDKLPVYGRICNRKVRSFLYKYLIFLKCDGITDSDMMKLYCLHLLCNKMEYFTLDRTKDKIKWKHYKPEYKNIKNMLDSLIVSIQKKEIDDITRSQFMVVTKCKVNPFKKGMVKKTKAERLYDAHKGVKSATDLKIITQYDNSITDEENAIKIGFSVRRIKQCKSEHPESFESKESRIKRLYDSTKSLRENAKLIGVSVNSVIKYKPIEVEEEEVKQVIKVNDLVEDDELNKWIDDELEFGDLGRFR